MFIVYISNPQSKEQYLSSFWILCEKKYLQVLKFLREVSKLFTHDLVGKKLQIEIDH